MPWHSSVVILSNGEIKTGEAKQFRDQYEIVTRGGIPYYFREQNAFYEWSVPVNIQHSYQSLVFKNPGDGEQALEMEDRLKLARCMLAHKNHTVSVEGFTVDEVV